MSDRNELSYSNKTCICRREDRAGLNYTLRWWKPQGSELSLPLTSLFLFVTLPEISWSMPLEAVTKERTVWLSLSSFSFFRHRSCLWVVVIDNDH
ncbi:hypothetical protein BCR43DRAFT_306070 [Syncephalastrum racemosum]|uniref:Uncharacterized protein n=1 Tax=Syncephalastrum racemosum TaxID=13706 RepID=A0A1X2HAC0_SYNRA|nr:hypothetical protein BCR43DRAFT_306070 [Syncephalastrum racemosum]